MQGKKEPIHTYVRVKPIFSNEDKVFSVQDNTTIINKNGQEFAFDHVFNQNSSTEEIYEITTKPIIKSSFQGFNGCVMAYGQTCSGKTHTVKGTPQTPGIVPLALSDIFTTIDKQRHAAKIYVSYIEIYNEKVLDLLADFNNQEIQIQSNGEILQMKNLKEMRVWSFEEAMQQFSKGEEKRKFASNNLNVNSSRSHTIFRIIMNICDDNVDEYKSQVDLVDLAGSQSIEKTKGEKISKTEAQNINKSLLALSKIIQILSEKKEKQNLTGISFRDSKLTRILQKSLCSNARSSIICMINPTEANFQESMNTLKFGQTASKIKIQARQNMSRTAESLKQPQFRNFEMEFLPSERIELEDARQKLKQNEVYINQLHQKIRQLEQDNIKKQELIATREHQLQETDNELRNQKQIMQKNNYDWWRQNQMLENRSTNYKEEIEKLSAIADDLKLQLRTLERNQKNLVENLKHYENQCRLLNIEMNKIKQHIDDESSRNSKRSARRQPMNIEKQKPIEKQNPFKVEPYQQNPDLLSPHKLAWIMKLKVEVIDLSRRVYEYTKANIEIAEQNEQLRKIIEQQQENKSKERSSGKINPEALQYNQIKKLNNKIKHLKNELKKAQQRQKKHRDILKMESARNIVEMEQYEEWYMRKYGGQTFTNQEVQTDHHEEEIKIDVSNHLNIFDRRSEKIGEKMEIEENPFIPANQITSPKSERLNKNQKKGLIFANNNPVARNQNPEDIKNSTNQKNKFILNEQKPVENENIDMNVGSNPMTCYFTSEKKEQRESNLLEPSPMVLNPFQNSNKNFVNMSENKRSIRSSKINIQHLAQSFQKQKEENKSQNNPFTTPIILEDQKDVQI